MTELAKLPRSEYEAIFRWVVILVSKYSQRRVGFSNLLEATVEMEQSDAQLIVFKRAFRAYEDEAFVAELAAVREFFQIPSVEGVVRARALVDGEVEASSAEPLEEEYRERVKYHAVREWRREHAFSLSPLIEANFGAGRPWELPSPFDDE